MFYKYYTPWPNACILQVAYNYPTEASLAYPNLCWNRKIVRRKDR